MGTFRFKSDLRNHCAIVQPRLYDCAMVTQITLVRSGMGTSPFTSSVCLSTQVECTGTGTSRAGLVETCRRSAGRTGLSESNRLSCILMALVIASFKGLTWFVGETCLRWRLHSRDSEDAAPKAPCSTFPGPL